MTTYNPDRVGRLRVVLAVVAALGVLVAVLAALVLTDGGHRGAGLAAMVIAGLLLGTSGTALRLLPAAGRGARLASVATGVVCLLCALGLAGSWLAFLMPLLGVGLLLLALLTDEPVDPRPADRSRGGRR